MPHPYLTGTAHPRVLAHRGLVLPAPAQHSTAQHRPAENTRASFEAAAAAGAEYIESDCHFTSDGRVVLFHDADLGRVVGVPRPVSDVTHRELAALMEVRGGLLTLDEALEAFPQARFNIDVKAAAAAGPAGRIVAPHAHRVLLTSFSDRFRLSALRAAGRAAGGRLPATSPGRNSLIRVLLAVGSRSRARTASALAGLDALQIPERQGPIRVLTPRLIDAAHEGGVEVHVWTVNDPQRMQDLVRLGVDGIVTDRADLALDVLRG